MSFSEGRAGDRELQPAKSGVQIELKLVIIGREGVGKSCMMMQYVRHCFLESTEPTDLVGEMNYTQRVVDGVAYRLQIIDTAGQEEYSVFQEQYYHSGHGFLAVLDLSDRESMAGIHSILTGLGRMKDMDNGDVHSVPCVLVANKCDLPDHLRHITKQDLEVFKRQYDTFPFFEASAKTRHNVEEAFESLIRQTQRGAFNCSPHSSDPSGSRSRFRSSTGAKKHKKNGGTSGGGGGKSRCNIL
jgi:small GTP-binding protein